MSTVEQLEEAVRRLSEVERAEFRAWYAAFEAAEWGRRLELDVNSGRLDWLTDEARDALRDGRCTER